MGDEPCIIFSHLPANITHVWLGNNRRAFRLRMVCLLQSLLTLQHREHCGCLLVDSVGSLDNVSGWHSSDPVKRGQRIATT